MAKKKVSKKRAAKGYQYPATIYVANAAFTGESDSPPEDSWLVASKSTDDVADGNDECDCIEYAEYALVRMVRIKKQTTVTVEEV